MAPLVDHYTAPDDNTFELVLNHSFAPLPSILPLPFLSVVPSEHVDGIATHPGGSGPFVFEEWRTGDGSASRAHSNAMPGGPDASTVSTTVCPVTTTLGWTSISPTTSGTSGLQALARSHAATSQAHARPARTLGGS